MAKAPAGEGRTLTDYIKDQRRAACAVCRLPDELRQQMAEGRARKIPRKVMLEWLTKEHDVTIADREMDEHGAGNHDRRFAS